MDIATLLFIIIFGVIVLAIILFLVFYLIARSKGKITIDLEKFEYSPGEKINGTLTLKLKEPLEAKSLNIGLLGTMSTRHYSSKGSNTENRNIFDFKKPISGSKTYPGGESKYNFNISIPSNILKQGTGNRFADSLIQTAQMLGGVSSNINWYVTANLDTKGFDISKSVRINII